MVICRGIAWLLLALAVAGATFEALNWLQMGEWRVFPLGELWFILDRSSLNLVQAGTQRYIHPALWDPVAITLLQWPLWALAGLPGLLLYVACRRRRRAPDTPVGAA